ncbi:MAG: hypothetical protein C5S40_04410 [ANME-2 cluster archaeon]|nr:hypothetical protein [ANME-2 cluster archaeon]
MISVKEGLYLSNKFNLIILLLFIVLATSGCTTNVGKYEVEYNDPELTEKNWCLEEVIFSISNPQTSEGYLIRYAGIEKIDGIEMCNLCSEISNENGTMQIDYLFDNSGDYFRFRIVDDEGNVQMFL